MVSLWTSSVLTNLLKTFHQTTLYRIHFLKYFQSCIGYIPVLLKTQQMVLSRVRRSNCIIFIIISFYFPTFPTNSSFETVTCFSSCPVHNGTNNHRFIQQCFFFHVNNNHINQTWIYHFIPFKFLLHGSAHALISLLFTTYFICRFHFVLRVTSWHPDQLI